MSKAKIGLYAVIITCLLFLAVTAVLIYLGEVSFWNNTTLQIGLPVAAIGLLLSTVLASSERAREIAGDALLWGGATVMLFIPMIVVMCSNWLVGFAIGCIGAGLILLPIHFLTAKILLIIGAVLLGIWATSWAIAKNVKVFH